MFSCRVLEVRGKKRVLQSGRIQKCAEGAFFQSLTSFVDFMGKYLDKSPVILYNNIVCT